jgi:hypothetical protein
VLSDRQILAYQADACRHLGGRDKQSIKGILCPGYLNGSVHEAVKAQLWHLKPDFIVQAADYPCRWLTESADFM